MWLTDIVVYSYAVSHTEMVSGVCFHACMYKIMYIYFQRNERFDWCIKLKTTWMHRIVCIFFSWTSVLLTFLCIVYVVCMHVCGLFDFCILINCSSGSYRITYKCQNILIKSALFETKKNHAKCEYLPWNTSISRSNHVSSSFSSYLLRTICYLPFWRCNYCNIVFLIFLKKLS